MQTVFLLTHIPNPRINKRISVARQFGEVVVISVRRSSQDIWQPFHKDIVHEIIQIDLPPSKQLIKRAVTSRKYAKLAHRLLARYQPDIIYTEGLDSLDIAVFYLHKHPDCKIVYEVADLRESFIEAPHRLSKRIVNYIVKAREKRLFKNVSNLIVTSEKFYHIHYSKLIDRKKTIFVPNIPDKAPFEQYRRKSSGDFTVGFIGGIRYLKQMKMLVDAAEKVGCRVLFAGAGGTTDDYRQITEYCRDKDFVTFTGRYDYNEDIARLYGMIDCVYAVYDADNANVRIALPNKLYESILCGLPIIVAKDTYLSELVRSWGVGISVSHTDGDELTQALQRLSSDKAYYYTFSQATYLCGDEIDAERHNEKLMRALNG